MTRTEKGRNLYNELIEPAPLDNEGHDYRTWAYRADEWVSTTLPITL